jgi:D-lyxose ketol-isomerase
MRRSDIEAGIHQLKALARAAGMVLPPFAHWGVEKWRERRGELAPTMARGLGWDVTDFGRGDFNRYGLTLLTLRNGSLAERDAGAGQTYAEKLMSLRAGQECPFHLHPVKTEDIINRGGGLIRVEIHQAGGSAEHPELDDGVVATFVSGVLREVQAGQPVDLEPGDSIQVPAGCYHRFWAVDWPVLAGEVSGVNDDESDNIFLEDSTRHPAIEEDVPARHLTVPEYAALLDDAVHPAEGPGTPAVSLQDSRGS